MKLFTSDNCSYSEADVNPSTRPGRLGYRSIPPGFNRKTSKEGDWTPDTNSESDAFKREGSATSLCSNDSLESLEAAKASFFGTCLDNSPSMTSSGYHSDDLPASNSETGVVAVNGDNSPFRAGPSAIANTVATSPSLSVSNTQKYDPKHYQDENNKHSSTPVSS